MNSSDRATVTLDLQTGDTLAKLRDLRNALAELNAKKQAFIDQGLTGPAQGLDKDIYKIESQINKMTSSIATAERTLKRLDQATPKELKETIRLLNKAINSGEVERGSEKWNAYQRAVGEAKAELARINEEQRALGRSTSESASAFGKAWGGVSQVFLGVKSAIQSVMGSLNEYTQAFASMDEHMAAVRKYTGMTTEEVGALNEYFKGMDTRTSREALNDLAADAGRLGIQGKQAVLDFVQAADLINIALGEDLGEDAVKNIGKLADVFGDSQRLGLKQAMLSTASTINELAQSSSASEPYLMEFASRLGGVGASAGMTQAQLLGIASVMDQNKVNVEKGATAMQNILNALFADTAKMAKGAGLDVQQFTALLKQDANEALLTFLEALNSKGGMDGIAPVLKELGMSGAGVTQTLTTLAARTDQLRSTQEQAAAAFAAGNSVVKEAAVANDTAAAKLEKAQNRLNDLRVQLGGAVLPVVVSCMDVMTKAGAVLQLLVQHIARNATTWAALTAAVVLYSAAVKASQLQTALHTAATKALTAAVAAKNAVVKVATALALSLRIAYYAATGQAVALRAAQIALNRTMKANPYMLVASLLLAIGTAIAALISKTRELSAAEKERRRTLQEIGDAERAANSQIAEQKGRVELLSAIIRDNNRTLAERRKALAELRNIVPGYLGELTKEGKLINDNKSAIDNYIKSLRNMALQKAIQDKYTQAVKEEMDAQLAAEAWERGARNRQSLMRAQGDSGYKTVMTAIGPGQVVSGVEKTDNQKALDADNAKAAKYRQQQAAAASRRATYENFARRNELDLTANNANTPTEPTTTTTTTTTTSSGGGNGKGGGKDNTDPRAEDARKMQEAAERQKVEWQAMYQEGLMLHSDYTEKTLQLDIDTATKQRDLYKDGENERTKYEKQRLDAEKRMADQKQAWSMAEIATNEKAALAALRDQYARGEITQKDYEQKCTDVKLDALKRRAKLAEEYGNKEAAAEYNAQYEAAQQDAAIERRKQYEEKVAALRKEYAQKSAEERMAIELATLEAVYNATDEAGNRISDMTEAQYKRIKELIGLKYEGKGGEIDKEKQAGAERALKMADYTGPRTGGGIGDGDFGFSGLASAAYTIQQQNEVYKNLERLRQEDRISQQEYEAACNEMDKQRYQNMAAVAEAAYASVSALMNSVTNLMQANMAIEEKKINRRYDAEIKAAGKNSKKAKKLEEQRQAELAKVKSKYAKKQAAAQIAMAIAQTAVNALKAYAAMADIPGVGPALGAIAAAAAVAAGAIQIATIKKQAEAQSEYYAGGFTGGNRYKQPAGVVHEGEFVANHQAVQNPAILPVLRLIDAAQRNNTVASLTADDVSRTLGAPAATAAATTATASNTADTAAAAENTAVIAAGLRTDNATAADNGNATLARLNENIERGIKAVVTIDGNDGVAKNLERYNKLQRPL